MAHEYLVKRDPKMPPVHPGELLREDAFSAMGMSVAAAARGMHISRQMLHGILAEKRGITPEMALRLGKLIGNGPGLWLRMQQDYDMWQAQARLGSDLRKIDSHVITPKEYAEVPKLKRQFLKQASAVTRTTAASGKPSRPYPIQEHVTRASAVSGKRSGGERSGGGSRKR